MKKLPLLLALAFMFSCASDTDQAIEEARFLLDQGSFAEAIAKLDGLVTADSTNSEAKFLLGSAYLGQAANEPRANCNADDTGILGILACFLREKEATDRLGLGTFARVAPTSLNEVDNLANGIALLKTIDEDNITEDNSFSQQDVFAQIALARLFTLSSVVTIAEANTGNEADCDADNITDDQASAFRADLSEVGSDLNNAGFPSDFRFLTRADEIFDALENAGFTDTTLGVRTIVADAFSSYTPACACATCEQAILDAFPL